MQQATRKYYSNGKILLTGEYLVLKGTKSLALPLNIGQLLQVQSENTSTIDWESFDTSGLFFSAAFSAHDIEIIATNDPDKAIFIQKLLQAAKQLNSKFLKGKTGYKLKSLLEFDLSYGLGSSSTLISNIAQWAQVDAFQLNQLISKGSGYDIACAKAKGPILYQLINQQPKWEAVHFYPSFINQLNLVYQNKKMPTESNIKSYLESQAFDEKWINMGNKLTDNFLNCANLQEFQELLFKHETLIGQVIGQTPVQQQLFKDFNGAVKSLGAWGGDFLLAASSDSFQEQQAYFKQKGFTTIIPLKKWLLNSHSQLLLKTNNAPISGNDY